MKETLLRALYMPILLYMILQPMLSYLDYLLDLNVKANTAYLVQRAGVEGKVTEELKQEVIQNLMAVGFSPSEIHIEADPTLRYRGERLNITIRVDHRRNLFPYWFTRQPVPNAYYGHGTIMSEYLE